MPDIYLSTHQNGLTGDHPVTASEGAGSRHGASAVGETQQVGAMVLFPICCLKQIWFPKPTLSRGLGGQAVCKENSKAPQNLNISQGLPKRVSHCRHNDEARQVCGGLGGH